jgi:acyl-coenzyme A synthetase/AMP-(fatty) acid ligase
MKTELKTLVANEVRAGIGNDQAVGAGNFLDTALKTNPAPGEAILFLEKPMTTFRGETFTQLTYLDLARLRDQYAGFYKAMGVQPQDPVMVYLDDGIEYLIHYLALTRLGAIGVLTNGNLSPEITALYAKRVGCTGIFTDASHFTELNRHVEPGAFAFLLTEQIIPKDLKPALYQPYVHADDDPIMIAHSSGTTGIPKAVLLQHDRFIYGVKDRLRAPRVPGGERILSSLPHSHNCAISYIMLALLSGTPVYVTSDHSGASVVRAIHKVKPTMLVSFPQTYVEMTEQDLDAFDLSSVNLWFNGGDAAHESHIRALIQRGSHLEDGKPVPGSIFIDGMGSSEMGFSLFKNIHTLKTNNYNRCVGKPQDWVDAQILSETGEKLGPDQVGRLAVKAPSVTSGYWNNSLLTYKSRLRGYFLTGDLAYKDEQGRFFHVDRTPDVIKTEKGHVYGLQTEEVLMSQFAGIADCTVFGETPEGSRHQIPVTHVRVRPNSALSGMNESQLLQSFNAVLAGKGMPLLSRVQISQAKTIPLGTTGKVLKRVLRESQVSL